MTFPNLTRRSTLGFLRAMLAPYPAVHVGDAMAGESAPTPALATRADGIAFVQAGTGAQIRSVEAKAREIVSVVDFGAKGDGTTDDTTAFNAAIATGKAVSVPYTAAGYAVANIDVVDNMQVVGEKAGMALAPTLIVAESNAAAFRNSASKSIFHCVFENLACRAGPRVVNASFYAQAKRADYSAYFTFRQIETYGNLRASYVGLFIFAVWDRCRDGYLGTGTDREHSAIVALADTYGQPNRQNLNRIKDSMFFNAFGGEAAITGSYGTLWTIENSNFEALRTRAFAAYDIVKVHFSNCWFEGINAPAIVHAGTFPGTHAASTIAFDCCIFALTGSARRVVTVEAQGSVALRGNMFNPVSVGVRLCDTGSRITVNEDNLAGSGAGAADFFTGTHQDSYLNGRRQINGASDNNVASMTFQNEGGIAATQGFMSRAEIRVASSFATVATSQTGLGGTCIVSGYDPNGGAQFRVIKDWQGATVRDVVPPLNATGRGVAFRALGKDLQMKVDTGSLIVFTTMLH